MKMYKSKTGQIGGAIMLGLIILIVGIALIWVNSSGLFSSQESPEAKLGTGTAGCQTDPGYTYSAVDKYSTASISGTDRIKADGNKPVTSLASPTVGDSLDYWKQNASVFCEIVSDTVKCGTVQVQTECYQNATITQKVKDMDNDAFLANGGTGTNITMGANAVYNLEYRYQGQKDKSALPFGGCMAIEYPSTISSVAVNGEGITGKACPYAWTYSVSSTSNTYKLVEVPAGFDADALGDLKSVDIQIGTGTTNPSGTAYITLAPANYYITNDGEIVLGIEKDQNSDTTKTFGLHTAFSFIIK